MVAIQSSSCIKNCTFNLAVYSSSKVYRCVSLHPPPKKKKNTFALIKLCTVWLLVPLNMYCFWILLSRYTKCQNMVVILVSLQAIWIMVVALLSASLWKPFGNVHIHKLGYFTLYVAIHKPCIVFTLQKQKPCFLQRHEHYQLILDITKLPATFIIGGKRKKKERKVTLISLEI